MARHIGKLQKIVGRAGFFKPQRVIGFELSREPDCTGGGELPVRPEQNIGARTDGLADTLAKSNRASNIAKRRLMSAS